MLTPFVVILRGCSCVCVCRCSCRPKGSKSSPRVQPLGFFPRDNYVSRLKHFTAIRCRVGSKCVKFQRFFLRTSSKGYRHLINYMFVVTAVANYTYTMFCHLVNVMIVMTAFGRYTCIEFRHLVTYMSVMTAASVTEMFVRLFRKKVYAVTHKFVAKVTAKATNSGLLHRTIPEEPVRACGQEVIFTRRLKRLSLRGYVLSSDRRQCYVLSNDFRQGYTRQSGGDPDVLLLMLCYVAEGYCWVVGC